MTDLTQLPDEIRAKIRDINTRANEDETYRQQLRDDPMGTLQAAGLPADAAQTVVDFEPQEEEVAAYRMCIDGTCWDITISSICPGTCFVTQW